MLSDVVLLLYKNVSFVVQILHYTFNYRGRYALCALRGRFNVKIRFQHHDNSFKEYFSFSKDLTEE